MHVCWHIYHQPMIATSAAIVLVSIYESRSPIIGTPNIATLVPKSSYRTGRKETYRFETDHTHLYL